MLIFCGNFWRTHVGASFWGSEKKIKYGNALVLLKKSSRTIFPVPEAPKNKIWICVDFGRFFHFSNILEWWDPEKAPRVGFEPTRDFGCPARLRAFGALPLDHSRACGVKGVHIAVMCGRTLKKWRISQSGDCKMTTLWRRNRFLKVTIWRLPFGGTFWLAGWPGRSAVFSFNY